MAVEHVPQTRPRDDVARGIAARAVQIGVMFLVIGVVLFGAAGRLDWSWGWAYLAIYLAGTLVNEWFLRRNPELVAGLDERFGWTGRGDVAWHLAGALTFWAGLALFGWAMIANAYVSTEARIQPERGQAVCREGPYRFVRHPGYVGAILQSIGTPFPLGSVWALLPAMAAGAFMAARTSFEDRMLMADLPGYGEYACDVRHRLLPGVW